MAVHGCTLLELKNTLHTVLRGMFSWSR